jgi:hypothetical protein
MGPLYNTISLIPQTSTNIMLQFWWNQRNFVDSTGFAAALAAAPRHQPPILMSLSVTVQVQMQVLLLPVQVPVQVPIQVQNAVVNAGADAGAGKGCCNCLPA